MARYATIESSQVTPRFKYKHDVSRVSQDTRSGIEHGV